MDNSGLVIPITDAAILDKFCNEFRLKRTTESGLSVIMPWVDPEITTKDLIEAVVRGYFYAIVTGALSVTVETPDKAVTIDDSTLDDVALTIDGAESEDILNLVDLAEWASTRKPQDTPIMRPGRLAWNVRLH
jgi:hypothetical protein